MQNMRWLISIALLLCLVSQGSAAGPESFRISTWDLESTDVSLAAAELAVEAAEIVRLSPPDILLLQGVPNGLFCDRLIQALEPVKYQTIVCSNFPDNGAAKPAGQVAIIARQSARSAGTSLWRIGGLNREAGGFAFAVFEMENHLVGIYSVRFADNKTSDENPALDLQLNILAREKSSEQLLDHIAEALPASGGEMDSVVIGGNFGTDPHQPLFVSEATLENLKAAGFESVFSGLPFDQRITESFHSKFPGANFQSLWVRNAIRRDPPTTFPSTLSDHSLVNCEIGLPRIESALVAQAESTAPPGTGSPPEPPPIDQAPLETPQPIDAPKAAPVLSYNWWLSHPYVIFWTAAGILILIAVIAQFVGATKRKRRIYKHSHGEILPARITQTNDSSAVVTCPVCDVSLIIPAKALPSNEPMLQAPSGSEFPLPYFDVCCDHGNNLSWRERALHAERRAEHAGELVKQGLLPHVAQWMKDKFLRRLLTQRAELRQTHQASTQHVADLEERLSRVNHQLRHKLTQYEERIHELEKESLDKDQVNRELLKAKIIATEAAKKARESKPQNPPQTSNDEKTFSAQFPSHYPPSA